MTTIIKIKNKLKTAETSFVWTTARSNNKSLISETVKNAKITNTIAIGEK